MSAKTADPHHQSNLEMSAKTADHQNDSEPLKALKEVPKSENENIYSEPVFLHQTRRLSIPSLSGGSSLRSTRAQSEIVTLRRSKASDEELYWPLARQMGSSATVSFRTKKTTTSGFFRKRKTIIDCGAFKKLPNG